MRSVTISSISERKRTVPTSPCLLLLQPSKSGQKARHLSHGFFKFKNLAASDGLDRRGERLRKLPQSTCFRWSVFPGRRRDLPLSRSTLPALAWPAGSRTPETGARGDSSRIRRAVGQKLITAPDLPSHP